MYLLAVNMSISWELPMVRAERAMVECESELVALHESLPKPIPHLRSTLQKVSPRRSSRMRRRPESAGKGEQRSSHKEHAKRRSNPRCKTREVGLRLASW